MAIIEQPDWHVIVTKCSDKMVERHEDYGNDWKKENDQQFWLNRVNTEMASIFSSDKKNEVMEGLLNTINTCAMYFTTLSKSKK